MVISSRTLSAVSLSAVLVLMASPALAKKGGGGGGGGGRPAAPQVNPAIATDQAAVVQARTDLGTATTAYNTAFVKVNKDFEASADFVAAKQGVTDATTGLQAAHDNVMASLADSADYKTASANEAKAQKEYDDLKDKDGVTQDDISAKSAQVFKLGGVTNKMEHDALDADPAYQAAQKKLSAANAAVLDLRNKFKDSLKTDATVGPLLQAKTDAQTKLDAAVTKLASDR